MFTRARASNPTQPMLTYARWAIPSKARSGRYAQLVRQSETWPAVGTSKAALALSLPEREGIHDHLDQATDERHRVSRPWDDLSVFTLPVAVRQPLVYTSAQPGQASSERTPVNREKATVEVP